MSQAPLRRSTRHKSAAPTPASPLPSRPRKRGTSAAVGASGAKRKKANATRDDLDNGHDRKRARKEAEPEQPEVRCLSYLILLLFLTVPQREVSPPPSQLPPPQTPEPEEPQVFLLPTLFFCFADGISQSPPPAQTHSSPPAPFDPSDDEDQDLQLPVSCFTFAGSTIVILISS